MPRERDVYDEVWDNGAVAWLALELRGREFSDETWRLLMSMPGQRDAALAYARNRYLEILPAPDLRIRYQELQRGLAILDDNGKLTFVADDLGSAVIDTATELVIRGESLTEAARATDWSFVSSPTVARAVAAGARRRLPADKWVLVKYGSREFMCPLLERGAVRVSPASYYDEPSLDPARRDEELQRVPMREEVTSAGVFRAIGDELAPDDLAAISPAMPIRAAVDYYVYCLAGGFQVRLFDDFAADSCVVITEPRRFLVALREAVGKKLPGWHYGNFPIRYVDPFEPARGDREIDPMEYAPWFVKHFRYAYQREIRIAWLPPVPRLDHGLDHVVVEVGPLGDYCELVEL